MKRTIPFFLSAFALIAIITFFISETATAGIHSAAEEVTYKEYWVPHSEFTGGWEQDPDGNWHETHPDGGAFYIEPWPRDKYVDLEIPDYFTDALKVEIYLDLWRNHESQVARFSINDGPTHAPDVGNDWSRTPYIAEIPKEELQTGTNTFHFWDDIGGYHVHDIAIRIYYDDDNPLYPGPGSDVTPPTGELLSITAANGTFAPQDGGVLEVANDELTFLAHADDADYVEFHGYYYGYDEDNNGLFTDWHSNGRHSKNGGPGSTINHIGVDKDPDGSNNYEVTWSLPHIISQSDVKFKIRIVDTNGNVRETAGGVSADFTILHPNLTAAFIDPGFVNSPLHTGGSKPDITKAAVYLPSNLSDYDEAYMIGAFWENPNININDNTPFSAFIAGEDDWALSIRQLDFSHLVPGKNIITYEWSGGWGHFIENPGPMIVLRRTDASGAPGNQTLTVNTNGSGSVTVDPDQVDYLYGEPVTLTATATTGWLFDSWSGGLNSSNATDTILMFQEQMVTATFTAIPYTLDTNVVGSGSVTKSPDQATYIYGDDVTVAANPDPGWAFSHWEGAVSGSNISETLTISQSEVVTAVFSQIEYTLASNVVGSGAITKDPDQATYHYDDMVTVTAVPDPGWTFIGWSGDLSGLDLSQTLTISQNHSVTATFSQDQYTLATSIVGDGTVTVSPQQASYVYGEEVTISATPDIGNAFDGWTGDIAVNSSEYTFTMTQTLSVVANFSIGQQTINIQVATGNGSITISPEKAMYDYGEVVTITAIPDEDWRFVNWSGDISGSDAAITFTVTGNLNIEANFEPDSYTLFLPAILKPPHN